MSILLLSLIGGSGCCIEGYPATLERDVTLQEVPRRVREAFEGGYDIDQVARIEYSEFRSRCAGDELRYRFHLDNGHSVTLDQRGRLARWQDGIRRSRSNESSRQVDGAREFQQLEYDYALYLANLEEHLTIAPNGRFRLTTRRGDGGPAVVEGDVPEETMKQLADLLGGWDRHYPGVPDGGETKIRYGDRSVVFGGGADIPEQVEQANQILRALIADHRSVTP